MVYEKEIKAMGEDIEELHKEIMGKYEEIYNLTVQELLTGENNKKEIRKKRIEIFELKCEIRRKLKKKYNL